MKTGQELGFSLEKGKIWGNVTVVFQYLVRTFKREGLLTRLCSDRTRVNGEFPQTETEQV